MTQLTTQSGTPVPLVSFGTMQFGEKASEADSAELFEDSLAAGITHFDTAWIYTAGRSEEILGTLIKGRDDLYIATKVGYTGGASSANMRVQFDTCRKRLQRDAVDLLYLHRFDPDTDLSETIETFASLQSDGLIRHIGLSNFAAWQVMKAQAIAAELGTRIDVLQPMYNLVKRQAEVELLPMCADQNIAACTYSPLGGGLLTGKYAATQSAGRLTENTGYATRYGLPEMHEAAQGVARIAAREGVHPATLAVAWVMHSGQGAQPILSARNSAQLAPSLAALDFQMSPELHGELTALMPSPPPATDRIEEA